MIRSNSYCALELAVESRKTTTQKCDVYNFGVLLLEMLTDREDSTWIFWLYHDMVDLPRWVRSVVREEWTAEVFDEENMLKRRWCRCFRLHWLVCQRW
jgi:hypothetical protein